MTRLKEPSRIEVAIKHKPLLLISILLLLTVTGTTAQTCTTLDASDVLSIGGTSHGVGDSLLESDLARDRLNAQIIVCSTESPDASTLRRKVGSPPDFDARVSKLVEANLLRRRGDRFIATFPILIGEQRERYVRAVARVADRVYRLFAPELTGVLAEVDARGWTDWQFHFLWSELFDSQAMWVDLINRGLVPPLSPLRYWVVYPPEPIAPGTNYYPNEAIEEFSLVVTWEPRGANVTDILGRNSRAVMEVALGERKPDASLSGTGILDENGELNIPVLRPADPLLNVLHQSSAKYAKVLEKTMPMRELEHLTGTHDRLLVFAMAYHDITYQLLSRYLKTGQLKLPSALRPGDGGSNLRGTAAIVPVFPPFIRMIEAAVKP